MMTTRRRFSGRALELGITFWDTANIYGYGTSEEVTGRAIKEFSRREDIVLATKLFQRMYDGPGGGGLSRRAVLEQVDASLRRLGTDYVDLLQIHRFDPAVPVEETMEALHDVVKAGKVRYLGASSMWAWRFAKMQEAARAHGWTPFVSMQDQYSLIYREEEREMFGLLADQGVGSLPWSPLGAGRLARPWGEKARPAGTSTPRPTRRGGRSSSTRTRPSLMRSSASRASAGPRWRRSLWPGCCVTRWSTHRGRLALEFTARICLSSTRLSAVRSRNRG
jgi:aryl-alcohol dehydrogenase-like predicted oxidoreductase